MYEGREPRKYKLIKLFMEHEAKFSEEYKSKLFELGEGIAEEEQMSKYDKIGGQAKLNFLALN